MNKSVIAGMVDVREDKGVVETDYYVREFFLRNRYRLFVDADVLIHPAAPKLWMRWFPLLMRYNQSVYITEGVIRELAQLALHKSSDSELCTRIADTVYQIEHFRFTKRIPDEKAGGTNATRLFDEIMKASRENHVLLLTFNGELAQEIMKNRRNHSPKDNIISVMKIDENGFINLHDKDMIRRGETAK